MPDSPRIQVYNRLWTLQEAEPYWASVIRAGNELRLTGDGWLRRRMRRVPVDFPAVWIDILGFGGTPFQQAAGFDAERPTIVIDGEWVETFDQEYEVKVYHADQDLTKRIDLDDSVIRAFRRGGPRLNPAAPITGVSRWRYATGTRDEPVDPLNPSGARKIVTTTILRVSFAFEGRDLL